MNPIWSLELTDGSETVNLGMVQPPSIMAPVPEGFGQTQFAPHKYDQLAQTIENQMFLENWNLVIGEDDTDDLSTQISKLLRLLRRAWQYWKQDRYNTPVYLIERGACETESRYSLVRECPNMNLPKPLANNAFESANLINGAGISIARFIWREGVPGVLPSLSTLTATNASLDDTLVHLSNYQDDHAVDTIFRLDQGAVWQADFELADPDFMWHADNASLSTGNIDFFVAGWFTLESFSAADEGLITKWGNAAGNREYSLRWEQATNRFIFYVWDGAGLDSVTANTFGAPALATLYFIVAWHTAATSELGISINLVEDTAVSVVNPQDSTGLFRLGAYNTGVGLRYYDGLMSSCGFWKAESTLAIRTCLYNSGIQKFYAELSAVELAGLVSYWEFGSGGLAFVNDSAGANNLTNSGATQIVGTAQAYSVNLIGTAAHNLWPAAPAVGDAYMVGSDEPFFDVVWNLVTAGVYTVTFAYEYSRTCDWGTMTLGDDLTLYPDDDPWDQLGRVLVNWTGATDWVTRTFNGQTKYWIRIRITAFTAMGVIPANGTYVVYNQRTPEVRMPANLSDGDISPYLMLRMRHPAGGDENPEMACTSRIILGKKSRGLTNFVSRLNLGNDGNPAGWAVTYGVDASAVASGATPGGDWCNIDFVGDSTMILRATVTGTAFLADLIGEYRVFMRVYQESGAAEELNVQLVVKINSAGADAPAIPFPERAIQDGGIGELVDMTLGGTLKIPFADAFNADDFTGGDIIFEIYAEQASGTSELYLMDLILIPADEWIVDLNDPISDATTGNSALRGLTLLDMDSGIVANRTVKQIIDGANIYLAETWSRRSNPMNIEPAVAARLYYVMAHYPSGGSWGDTPWIGSQGMHLTAELFKQNTFLYLRGDT